MSEENNNSKVSETKSTADETKKLSEDARGLGPRQTGPFAIGCVDAISWAPSACRKRIFAQHRGPCV